MIAKYLFFLILFMVILIHAFQTLATPHSHCVSEGGQTEVCACLCVAHFESVRPRIRTFFKVVLIEALLSQIRAVRRVTLPVSNKRRQSKIFRHKTGSREKICTHNMS